MPELQRGAFWRRGHKSSIPDFADPEFDNRIVLFEVGSIRFAFAETGWLLLTDGNTLQTAISMKQKYKYLQATVKIERGNPYLAERKYARKLFDIQLRKLGKSKKSKEMYCDFLLDGSPLSE